jgi:hypothetical protein
LFSLWLESLSVLASVLESVQVWERELSSAIVQVCE